MRVAGDSISVTRGRRVSRRARALEAVRGEFVAVFFAIVLVSAVALPGGLITAELIAVDDRFLE